MGLFDELDIAGAADDPWAIPDNVYPAVVSKVEVKTNADGNYGMYFTYTLNGGEFDGRKVSEYKRLPHPKDATPLEPAAKETAKSYIKERLASLGIPEERMNSIDTDDLVAIECYIATKQNGKFTNVREIYMEAPGGVSTSSKSADPFA